MRLTPEKPTSDMPARIYTGCLIASTAKAAEQNLWFVFHAEGNDVLALDLTRAHPALSYDGFENVIKSPDNKDEKNKIVLFGGSMNSDNALSILHETVDASKDSIRIDEHFSLRTYKYVLVPGKPPAVEGKIGQASTIAFSKPTDFLVVMGFTVWEMHQLQKDVAGGIYKTLPATKDILFGTNHQDRLSRALRSIN